MLFVVQPSRYFVKTLSLLSRSNPEKGAMIPRDLSAVSLSGK
jgi:hypothetical protein